MGAAQAGGDAGAPWVGAPGQTAPGADPFHRCLDVPPVDRGNPVGLLVASPGDVSILERPIAEGVPIVTHDQRLADAARAAALPVLMQR